MTFRVFNTLGRTKETFESLEPKVVRMYNCGPTVYDRAHIGNFRSYLFADVLRRWLEHEGWEVRQVMNVTDVGHLTDEVAGEGEDRIQARAAAEGADPWEISRRYEALFLADARELRMRPALANPRATDHVPEMLEMIEGLVDRGHAYQVDGNVYFDVTSFERYGALSGNRIEALDAGARIAVREEKRHPADFALWKSDPRHLMKWDSRFGPHGFPGWHIECSAMARRLLGDRIDVHTGGEDNVFPHHECEIAQSECFTGQPFARYWMHAKFLQVDGGKMSKSLGNVWTLDDVEERGHAARTLRYLLVRGHYRQPINFTWDLMEESRSALESLDEMVARLRHAAGGGTRATGGEDRVERARARFERAMNDDLLVPEALAAVFGLRHHAVKDRLSAAAAERALAFLGEVDQALAILELEGGEPSEEERGWIEERDAARAERDYARADELRERLLERGIVLEDTPHGAVWRRR